MNIEDLHWDLKELIKKVDILIEAQNGGQGKESEWVTKEGAMKMLNCSERTLQTLRDNKSMPFSNPTGGSKFLYRRRDVEKLLESAYNGKR